jgi:hypothetical protein
MPHKSGHIPLLESSAAIIIHPGLRRCVLFAHASRGASSCLSMRTFQEMEAQSLEELLNDPRCVPARALEPNAD